MNSIIKKFESLYGIRATKALTRGAKHWSANLGIHIDQILEGQFKEVETTVKMFAAGANISLKYARICAARIARKLGSVGVDDMVHLSVKNMGRSIGSNADSHVVLCANVRDIRLCAPATFRNVVFSIKTYPAIAGSEGKILMESEDGKLLYYAHPQIWRKRRKSGILDRCLRNEINLRR